MPETTIGIYDFFDSQISKWNLAAKNYADLRNLQIKHFRLGEFRGKILFNPARAISTLANTDKEKIMERKCFLCEANRPKEQDKIEILPGWDLLVNPFPILPFHFTIAGKDHVEQKLDFDIGIRLAEKLPGMLVFFNDLGAGASAPDHIHFQAVPAREVPLIQFLEKFGESAMDRLPYKILSSENEITRNERPKNVFFWREGESTRFVAVPRRKHRPETFFLLPPERRAVSPGALDIAGLLVTPFEEDFHLIDIRDVRKIYMETTYTHGI